MHDPDDDDGALLRLATWQLALDAGAAGKLLRLDPHAAWITLPKFGAVLLTTVHDPERLTEIATDFRQRATKEATLVVLGGGLDVREQLEQQPPLSAALPGGFSLGQPRGVSVVHIDHWGRPWPKPVPELEAIDPRKPAVPDGHFQAAANESLREARAFARWQGAMQARRPWGTYALCGAILGMFLVELASGGTDSLPVLIRSGGLTRDILFRGEIWQLASASFVHGGFIHVLFAVGVLWMLGGFLERLIGTPRFLVLYFLSALGGTFMAVPTALLGGTVVGSSTALWGILVAHFVLSRRPRGLLPEALIPQARRVATINLLLNAAVSFLPGVSLLGHLGGGLVGWMLLMPGILQWGLSAKVETPASRRVFRLGAALLAGLFATALLIAVTRGTPWVLAGEPTLEGRELTEGLVVQVPAYLEQERHQHGRVPRDPASIKVVEHHPQDPERFVESWNRLHPEDTVLIFDQRLVTARLEKAVGPEPAWVALLETQIEEHPASATLSR